MLFSDGIEQFIGGFTTLHATFINIPGFNNDLVGKYSCLGQRPTFSTVLNIAGVDSDLLGKQSWPRQRPPWHIPLSSSSTILVNTVTLVECAHVAF